jgi:hypothetical protein
MYSRMESISWQDADDGDSYRDRESDGCVPSMPNWQQLLPLLSLNLDLLDDM